MSSTLIKNIGTFVTGMLEDPLRDADSFLVADGAIQEIGIVRAGAAVVLYGIVLHFHGWAFGVPAVPL